MTSLIFSKPKNTDDEENRNEISLKFKELSVLSKFLPGTELDVIEKLKTVIEELSNNPDILKHKMLKLKIADRYSYSFGYSRESQV